MTNFIETKAIDYYQTIMVGVPAETQEKYGNVSIRPEENGITVFYDRYLRLSSGNVTVHSKLTYDANTQMLFLDASNPFLNDETPSYTQYGIILDDVSTTLENTYSEILKANKWIEYHPTGQIVDIYGDDYILEGVELVDEITHEDTYYFAIPHEAWEAVLEAVFDLYLRKTEC